MKNLFISAGLILGVATGAAAEDTGHDFGLAGILSKSNRVDLPKITMATGKALADEALALKSGRYYVLDIESDGSAELALEGANFWRAVWIDEIVINDPEVRPFGVQSFEFDDEGTIQIKFVAIKPGQYQMKIHGSRGDSQKIDITIQ